MTITLPKTQWVEIKEGLKKGKHDARLIKHFEEAIAAAEIEQNRSDEIIEKLKNEINITDQQIENYRMAIYKLQNIKAIGDRNLIIEKNKRIGVSAIFGGGYGTGSNQPQLFIGAGLTYQFLKF